MSELVTLALATDDAGALLLEPVVNVLEQTILPTFLPRQRWFAEKGATLEAVRLIDAARLGEADGSAAGPAYVLLVEIEPSRRLYALPVAIVDGSGGGDASPAAERATLARVQRVGERVDEALSTSHRPQFLVDALAFGDAPLALLADVAASSQRPTARGGTLVGSAAPSFATAGVPAAPAVRRLAVEQSNTSVVLGEAVILKGYRRVHRGPQPELEIARFLDAVEFRNTPALIGSLEYAHPASAPVALCILQRFAASRGDGWVTTSAYLREFFAAVGPAGPAAESEHHAAFAARLWTLGRRTAELHAAFATPLGDPAFEPEPTTAQDVADWIAQAQSTADQALTSLRHGRATVPPELRAPVAALLGRRDEIMDRLADVAVSSRVMKTRYHGDFHLGQVLAVDDDFLIVDFEGEPGRDASVRRRKSSPLRDVAGMVRSLNYAAVAGRLDDIAAGGTPRADANDALARDWERRSVAAFLDGYWTTIAGRSSVPADPDQTRRLLDLFVLEKAFYEMSYELANRPLWLRIPLEGVQAILDAGHYARTANS